jgi:uncharacterized protein
MPTNREFIRSLYAAFGRGDAGTVLGMFDPEIVWLEAENSPYADRNPYVGPQQVAEGAFGRIMSEWEGFTVTPETLLEDGNVVVAMGRYRGTFQATRRPLDAQFVHVWTVRDGRVTRFQQYADTAQFARVTDAAVAAVTAPTTAAGMPSTSAPAATAPA